METVHFSPGEAAGQYGLTGFEQAYARSVRGSRILAGMSSRVLLPDTVELPVDRPVIIAANHSSLFDLPAALITLGTFGVTARIAVNSRFFMNPVGGSFLRRIGCIPFSRDDRESAEASMANALHSDQVCALMPEGRIVRPGDQDLGVGPGRPGVSRIARAAGAAIVPVGFGHADLAWRPGRPLPRVANRSNTVIARFGAPLFFETDDHEANVDRLMGAISSCVLEARTATTT